MTQTKAAFHRLGLHMDIQDQKRVLRRTVLTRRGRLSKEERAAASQTIAGLLMDLLAEAPAVVAFASFGAEVSTDPIIDSLLKAGRTVLLPYVDGTTLRATPVASLEEVAPGYRGIREPIHRAPVEPAGAILVPGVAFDASGNRLGYGGGFYDSFLAASANARPRIGVCFDCQLVDGVPTGPADQPVEAVVTEAGVVRVPAR